MPRKSKRRFKDIEEMLQFIRALNKRSEERLSRLSIFDTQMTDDTLKLAGRKKKKAK